MAVRKKRILTAAQKAAKAERARRRRRAHGVGPRYNDSGLGRMGKLPANHPNNPGGLKKGKPKQNNARTVKKSSSGIYSTAERAAIRKRARKHRSSKRISSSKGKRS